MPKDATKNVDRYKIRGGQLNEFDFHQNQEEFSEQQKTQAANLIPGTPPEAKKATTESTKTTKRVAKATKATRATKATKSAKARKAPVGATAKKLAARKAAKKK